MKLSSLAVLMTACCLFGAPVAHAQKALLCDHMSGVALPPKGLPLSPALEKAKTGEFPADYKLAYAVMAEFSKLAGSLFLEAETPQTMVQARSLVDGQLLTADGILAVRGDFFTVRHDVLAWLAWLGCRAGEFDSALYWLRLGVRDYPKSVFDQEAALVLLAAGRRDEAAKHLTDKPEKVFQLVAAGWYACAGRDASGSALLEKAAALVTEEQTKGRLAAWAKECAGGKFAP